MIKVREAFLRASSFLGEKGISEPAASAELLLQHALEVDRTRLLVMWSDPIDESAYDALWSLVQRRAAGEPVQYITGETYFYGLRFAVNKWVLIPRPETELLVERVALLGSELWGDKGTPQVVDIGTGSGAIAVSLSCERPHWRVAGCDISPEALQVARSNAEKNNAQVQFLEGNWLEPAVSRFGNAIDILVSNPPYIRTGELPDLQVEVREYEPALALDGGEDGLTPYRRMLDQMREFDVWPSLVGLECGLGQARELQELLRRTGHWTEVAVVEDYAGIDRHVIGIRR